MLGAEKAVRKAIRAKLVPPFDESLWKSHKAAFIAAQHGKCGYCEQPSRNHPGAVEHYAPKSRVEELIADGVEIVPTASVKGRKTPVFSATGYWWLAYAWENWLFACERCNTAWKKCLFPVREKRRALPPGRNKKETPLLISPFGRVEPFNHLYFSRVGQIAARAHSDRGEATIRTCGLDRESLRGVRERLAADTYRYIDRLLVAIKKRDFRSAHEAVEDLLSIGEQSRAHAGMVRSIVREELGHRWSDMVLLEQRFLRRVARR